jgi:hypothetical protein
MFAARGQALLYLLVAALSITRAADTTGATLKQVSR